MSLALACYAVDEIFIDIDLDFQRIHVHDRTDAGPSETAAGGDRRNHFTRLRGLDRDDAGKRRTHDGIVQIALGDAEGARDDIDVAALGGELRPQRIHGGLRIVHGRLTDEMSLEQALLTVVVALGIGEIDLRLGESGLGVLELGAGLIQRCADIGIVELGDDLARVDVVAFLDIKLHHLGGDLGRHRGLAARHHITRRIQNGAGGGRPVAGNRLCRSDVHGNGAGPCPPPSGNGSDRHDCRGNAQPDPASAGRH